jgi:hypothetical protein
MSFSFRSRRINFTHRNIFLNYNGKPSIYLPCCMIVWGLVSALTGNLRMSQPIHILSSTSRNCHKVCIQCVVPYSNLPSQVAFPVPSLLVSLSDLPRPHFSLVLSSSSRNGTNVAKLACEWRCLCVGVKSATHLVPCWHPLSLTSWRESLAKPHGGTHC